jgi:predicted chitinase
MKFYYGIVENRQDPLTLGRCQVRIAGVHTHDKSLLPTEDLPWSMPVSPITSGAMNGIGNAPLGPVEGTTVLITFADGDRMQQPIMFGSIGGISSVPLPIDANITGEIDAASSVKLSNVRLETTDIYEEALAPTTTNQLTFKDYENGLTNLTSSLAPDMRVIGFGLPDNTRIVSIDSGLSITINNMVTDYGRNIITFEPAPLNIQALNLSNDYVANEVPLSGPVVGNTTATRPANSATNREIPVIPPEGSASNTTAATEGIRALIHACDQVGLTTKEQKCALLGIVGGESGWVPKEEYYNYSESRLQQIYSFATAADVERYARAPNKGVSKEEFFNWAYGPTTRGNGFLGNLTDEDGGKFYGRGFIQLTGRYNYERYARQAAELGLSADIVNNPNLLNDDINVSAIIAALYLKDRVADDVPPAAHPNYFYAAKRAVGYNSSDIAARKLSYYEYFYGLEGSEAAKSADQVYEDPISDEEREVAREIQLANDRATRVALIQPELEGDANTRIARSPEVEAAVAEALQKAIETRERLTRRGIPESAFVFGRNGDMLQPPADIAIEDEDPSTWGDDDAAISTFTPQPSVESLVRGTLTAGFRDPNTKYPLSKYIDEPDTNRLARGIIEGTIVELKDQTRITGLKKPFGGTWSQPEVPFGAQYPFNHVYESESGHIHEIDDTPGQERLNIYHRSGTYTEVDANGTQVNYIVGDNYVLMERNGNIHVAGECNITTEGQVNIMVQSDANINVSQNANIEVGNNVNLDVHRDMNTTVGGDYRINVEGEMSITAASVNTWSKGAFQVQADGETHLYSGTDTYVNSGGETHIKADTTLNMSSTGNMDILSGATMNVDYTLGNFGDGATAATKASTIGDGWQVFSRQNDEGDDWTFVVPDEGQPINRSFTPLLGPERQFEMLSTHETPDEWDTPEGRYQSNELRIDSATPGATIPEGAEAAPPATGGTNRVIPVNCQNIEGTTVFGNDFRLSENFTLGMLIDGGVNGRHRLVDQMLSDGNQSRLYTKQEIVCNLAMLAQNVLEPMLEVLPGGIDGYRTQWQINSGYRLRGVVGNESARSQHPKGQAVDIGIYADGLSDKFRKHFEFVTAAERIIPYDQLILEYRHSSSNWVHVSYAGNASRRMAFTMVNDSTYRRDANGVPAGFYLLDRIPPKG